ncbi:sigma-70, region 4 [Bacteriovorax sp. Seq25_V]|nr:sigma-70, region 4 [Bacteriovorax sp. Seq25_V]
MTALDKEAISLLVDSYTDHLFRAGLGSGLSEEMAYDLAASTWTTFLEVVPRFEGRSHIRTFLFGIFYNKLAELRRANLKFQKTDPIEEILESSFEDDGHWNKQFMDPSLLAQNNEIMAIIEQCMEHLPMLQRSAFMMKLVDGEESDFICETLGITDGNLRQLIFRAKAKIRDCIEKNIN